MCLNLSGLEKRSEKLHSSVLKSTVQDLHKCDRTKYLMQIKILNLSKSISPPFPLGITVQIPQLECAAHAG